MRLELLKYLACPVCQADLALKHAKCEDGEVREGVIACSRCGREYPVIGFLPILTPPGVKPYDWISAELTKVEREHGLREAVVRLARGELRPHVLGSGEPLLSREELLEGEWRESRA